MLIHIKTKFCVPEIVELLTQCKNGVRKFFLGAVKFNYYGLSDIVHSS